METNHIITLCILAFFIVRYIQHLFSEKKTVLQQKQIFKPSRIINTAKKHELVDVVDTEIMKNYYMVREGDCDSYCRIKEFKKSTIEESKIAAEKYISFLITNTLILRSLDSYKKGGKFTLSLILVDIRNGNYYHENVVRVIKEKTMVI